MGQRERLALLGSTAENIGALSSMYLIDACCIAKAYINAGIARGGQVRHLRWNYIPNFLSSWLIFQCHL